MYTRLGPIPLNKINFIARRDPHSIIYHRSAVLKLIMKFSDIILCDINKIKIGKCPSTILTARQLILLFDSYQAETSLLYFSVGKFKQNAFLQTYIPLKCKIIYNINIYTREYYLLTAHQFVR